MTPNQISLNPLSIARTLGVVAFLLVLTSIGLQLIATWTGHTSLYGIVRIFNVDNECNIPTFFSTLLLLFAALLLVIITVVEKNRTASHVLYWTTLSIVFFCMAIDETCSFHERLCRLTVKLLGDVNHGIFYFAWVIPGMALVLVLALFFLRFLLHLPPKTRRAFLMAAILYLGGAIGFELIGGRYVELHRSGNLTYTMIATVEESLEMAGVIVFIWALLVYIAGNYKEVRFKFDTAGLGSP